MSKYRTLHVVAVRGAAFARLRWMIETEFDVEVFEDGSFEVRRRVGTSGAREILAGPAMRREVLAAALFPAEPAEVL